jgi:purine-binding chemotaxis protein CheW
MEGILMRTATEALITREEFLSFRLGQEEYAIDVLQVREIRAHEAVTRIAGTPDFIRGVINLRGAIVPIVDMRLRFRLDSAAYDANTVVIVLNIHDRPIGIVVDAVSDVVALAADEIRPTPAMKSAIEQGFIRGLAPVEGRMLILLDISKLMSSTEMALAEEAVG